MTKWESVKASVEQTMLDSISPLVSAPLRESMTYALSGGGKRLRPLLFLSQLPQEDWQRKSVLLFAAAIEILHNYTLVHDDLPCMDDDDLRRGQPTVHKKFGVAIATLCGDALLNLACECIADAMAICDPSLLPLYAQASREFFRLTGASGLISGQVEDLDLTVWTEEKLRSVYEKKTCNLFIAALTCGAILSGGDVSSAWNYGFSYGFLFQLSDDLTDGETNAGALAVYGEEGTRERLDFYLVEAQNAAKSLKNADFLQNLALKAWESAF